MSCILWHTLYSWWSSSNCLLVIFVIFIKCTLNRHWHMTVFFVYPALHLDLLVSFTVVNSESRQLTIISKATIKMSL